VAYGPGPRRNTRSLSRGRGDPSESAAIEMELADSVSARAAFGPAQDARYAVGAHR